MKPQIVIKVETYESGKAVAVKWITVRPDDLMHTIELRPILSSRVSDQIARALNFIYAREGR